VTLGKRIVKELDLEDSVDTLGRWMAHRIVELMERAEQAETEAEREAAKESKCNYQVMGTQSEISFKPPLADIARNLTSDPSPSTGKNLNHDGTWDSILPHLEKLQEREDSICRDAAIAEASLESKSVSVEEHREEISDDECGIIEYLLKFA